MKNEICCMKIKQKFLNKVAQPFGQSMIMLNVQNC